MNPVHFSSVARVIQAVLPHFTRQEGSPQQHLVMGSDQGSVTVVTTRTGVELAFSGEAIHAMAQISAKMINLEIYVENAPDISGPADLVFVGGSPRAGSTAQVVPFKCVYLPRRAPQLY